MPKIKYYLGDLYPFCSLSVLWPLAVSCQIYFTWFLFLENNVRCSYRVHILDGSISL